MTAFGSQVGSSTLTFERGPLSSSLYVLLSASNSEKQNCWKSTRQSNGNTAHLMVGPVGPSRHQRGPPSTLLQGQVHITSRQAAGLSSRPAKGSLARPNQMCLHSAGHGGYWEICLSRSPQQTGIREKNMGWERKQVLIPPCLCHS